MQLLAQSKYLRKSVHSHRLADAAYRALVKRTRLSNATAQAKASGLAQVIDPTRAERFHVDEVSPVMADTVMAAPASEEAAAPNVVMEDARVEEHSADYSRIEESIVLSSVRLAKDLSKV